MNRTIIICNLIILLFAFEAFSNEKENKTIINPFKNVIAGKGIRSDCIPIRWQTNKKFDFHFQVFRGTTDDWHDAYLIAGNIPGNSYTDTTFGFFYYWIRAYDKYGMSYVSEAVQGYRQLEPPKNIRASEGVYIDKVSLPPPINKNVEYKIWRNDSSNSKKNEVAPQKIGGKQ
jgi:hypothetical protein